MAGVQVTLTNIARFGILYIFIVFIKIFSFFVCFGHFLKVL